MQPQHRTVLRFEFWRSIFFVWNDIISVVTLKPRRKKSNPLGHFCCPINLKGVFKLDESNDIERLWTENVILEYSFPFFWNSTTLLTYTLMKKNMQILHSPLALKKVILWCPNSNIFTVRRRYDKWNIKTQGCSKLHQSSIILDLFPRKRKLFISAAVVYYCHCHLLQEEPR